LLSFSVPVTKRTIAQDQPGGVNLVIRTFAAALDKQNGFVGRTALYAVIRQWFFPQRQKMPDAA
jgi:hypothetical protein